MPRRGTARRVRRGPAPLRFLGFAIAWTWTCWWGAVALGLPWTAPPAATLYVLGSLGPLIAALALVALGYADGGVGTFLRRAFDPREAPPRAWLATAALLAAAAAIPILAVAAGRGVAPGQIAEVGAPLAFLLVGALAGAVEEPGWRGYAQLGLQRRMPVLTASLVVGAVWAIWHLPLFFLEGTYQASLGVGTPAFYAFFAAILLGSPVYAWLLGTARGATVIAVAYHGFSNVTAELFGVDGAVAWNLLTEAGIAALVVAIGLRWMTRMRHDSV